MTNESTKISLFHGKQIRRIFHKNEWWFSVVDVTTFLTDSPDAGAYWRKLKQRLVAEGSQVVTFCHGLKLEASDGSGLIEQKIQFDPSETRLERDAISF